MLHSLHSRLWLLFLAFLLLVIGSVTVMFGAVASQRDDARVINLAGRQRMLSQQMTWLALRAPDDPALELARGQLAQTLTALREGGKAVDGQDQPVTLPRIADPAARAGLDEAWQAWLRFDELLHATPQDADWQAALTAASLTLLDALDRVVARLSALAAARVQRLQIVQLVFLGLALGLLAWGYRLTTRRVVQPLDALGASAQRMAAGDLAQAVPTFGDRELGRLAQALEVMRVEVLASRRHLEARVDQRTRELTTAFEFSQEIAAQLELARLLESVTDRARTLMGGRAAALCLLDDQDGMLRLAAGSGDGQVNPALRQPVTAELPRQVIGEGRTVAAETSCSGCGFLRRLPDSQCTATPLRVGEQTLGALCVARPRDASFDAEEQAAFALLGNAAAVAIVNARLVEAGRVQAEADAIQVERGRLAAELHDNLAQTLSFLNFKVDRLHELIAAGDAAAAEQELATMRGATTRAYGQVRAALTGLQAPEQEAGAFAAQLAACVAEIEESTGLRVTLEVSDRRTFDLPAVARQQVLHIVREALVNVWRHAGTDDAWVTVRVEAGDACFTVRDEGRGFAPERVDETTHLGLAIMRARAERSGGSLRVASRRRGGTEVCVRYPLVSREVVT